MTRKVMLFLIFLDKAHQKTHLLLFSLMVFGFVFLSQSARGTVPLSDSGQTKKPYKLSEPQFLDKYGKDDSSRALIRYYFQRPKAFRKSGLISAGIAGVSAFFFRF